MGVMGSEKREVSDFSDGGDRAADARPNAV